MIGHVAGSEICLEAGLIEPIGVGPEPEPLGEKLPPRLVSCPPLCYLFIFATCTFHRDPQHTRIDLRHYKGFLIVLSLDASAIGPR